MVELVHLRAVDEDAGLLVADERVLVPRIPQAAHHLDELAPALVALGLRQVRLLAEVLRLGFVAGCHHVPAGAAAADEIERRELAGDGIGLLEARAGGADEADVLGVAGQRREQRIGLHPGAVMHAIDGRFRHGPDGVVVRREQHVEQPALGDLRHLDEMRKIDAGVGLRARMPPAGDMMAAGPDEQPEFHFPCGHGSTLLDHCRPASLATGLALGQGVAPE